MANKGPGTNSSQFFLTYDSARHLDKKHTIFGQILGNLETLDKLERVPVAGDRPKSTITISTVQILLDPFAEFLERQSRKRAADEKQREVTEDDLRTWNDQPVTNTRARITSEDTGVGKYISQSEKSRGSARKAEPPTKKFKARGGFGDFSAW